MEFVEFRRLSGLFFEICQGLRGQEEAGPIKKVRMMFEILFERAA